MTWLDLLICPACGRIGEPWQHARAIREGTAEVVCRRCGQIVRVTASWGVPDRAESPVNRGRECWIFEVEVEP